MAGSHIYKDQPYTLVLETDTDLSTASTKQIKWVAPSGATGLWTATLVAGSTTKIYYVISGAANNESGKWTFRAWVTWAGDANAVPGTPYYLNVEAL